MRCRGISGDGVRRPRNIISPTPAVSSAASGAYDAIDNVVFGVSIRLLNGSYSGSCLRIRRSSDNAEQDIGFSGTSWDTAAMESFCGAGDGFVVTWYDQYGSINPTQATASQQPKIVSSGTALASPEFTAASSQVLNAAGVAVAEGNPATYHAWFTEDNGSGDSTIISTSDKDATQCWRIVYASGASANDILTHERQGAENRTAYTSTAYTAGTHNSATGVFASATDRRSFLNAGGKATDTGSVTFTEVFDSVTLGARYINSAFGVFLTGHISEAIITSDAKSDGDVSTIHGIGDPTA